MMYLSSRRFWIILSLLLAASVAHAADAPLQVEDPWVREGPPSANVLAGFMVLSNPSATPLAIVAVSSPAFAEVEMHRTEMVDGMARMLHQDRIEVPAHGSVSLEPGGMHLMLFDPVQPLKAGDKVTFQLSLDGGASATVEAEVRNSGGMQDHSHHHH